MRAKNFSKVFANVLEWFRVIFQKVMKENDIKGKLKHRTRKFSKNLPQIFSKTFFMELALPQLKTKLWTNKRINIEEEDLKNGTEETGMEICTKEPPGSQL